MFQITGSLIVSLLLAVTIASATDVDIGQIIELSPDHRFIQVHDKIYRVEHLTRQLPDGEPEPAEADELTEGAMVRIERGTKENGFWHCRSLRILQGTLAEKKRQDMELSASGNNPAVNGSPASPLSGRIFYENGVWQNR